MKNLLLIFIGIVILALTGCGGGGPSNDTPTPTPVTMVLKISTEGPDSSFSGIGFTYTLPAGVTVATNPNGSVAAGVAVPSGVISSATAPSPQIYYTPAGTEPAKLDIVVASNIAGGFGIGEFFSITVTRPTGNTAPTAADFSLINFAPANLLYQAIDGINCKLTVQ
jgi:hypothetical protein